MSCVSFRFIRMNIMVTLDKKTTTQKLQNCLDEGIKEGAKRREDSEQQKLWCKHNVTFLLECTRFLYNVI